MPRGCYPLSIRLLNGRIARKSAGPWTSCRPRRGFSVYRIHNGFADYHRQSPGGSYEPPWLKFFNLLNGYTPVKTCEKLRRYVEKRLGVNVAFEDYVWLSYKELNYFIDYYEGSVNEVNTCMDSLIYASGPNSIRDREVILPPSEPLKLLRNGRRLFLPGPNEIRDGCRNARTLGNNFPTILRTIPKEYTDKIGVKHELTRTSSRKKNFRDVILTWIVRILYQLELIETSKKRSKFKRACLRAVLKNKSLEHLYESIALAASQPLWGSCSTLRKVWRGLIVHLPTMGILLR